MSAREPSKVSEDDLILVRTATAGFVLVTGTDAQSFGSGTYVSFGKVKGILTCAHVARELQRQTKIGLLVPDGLQQQYRLEVATEHLDAVIYGDGPWSASGPDLAFLRMPDAVAADIGARATFLSGDRQREFLSHPAPDFGIYFQASAGVVANRTFIKSDTPKARLYGFTGVISRCIIADTLDIDGVDTYVLRHFLDEGDDKPTSYGGSSGGGVWRLYFRDNDQGRCLLQTRLIGVAFWQRGDDGLNAHGPKAIFEILHGMILEKWPEARAC